MFAALSLAVSQFLRTFTMLFSGMEQGASAFNNIMGVANDASGSMADVATVERKIARHKALADARADAAAIGLSLDDNLEVKTTKVKAIASA